MGAGPCPSSSPWVKQPGLTTPTPTPWRPPPTQPRRCSFTRKARAAPGLPSCPMVGSAWAATRQSILATLWPWPLATPLPAKFNASLQELGQGWPGIGCRSHPCICTEGVAGLWGLHLPTAWGARFATHLSPQPQFTQEPSESALALTPGREGSPHGRAPALEPGMAWRSGCTPGCHCKLHASSLDI